MLAYNAAQMNLDLHEIDALLSATPRRPQPAALASFLKHSRPGLPLIAHPDLFRQRYTIEEGAPRQRGLRISQTDLTQRTTLRLSAAPLEILPRVWTSGEISERNDFEGRSAHHFIQSCKGWLPDPYRDDLSLALEVPSGIIVICGCCHAGLLNTLAHVQRLFNRDIAAIIGGAHLGEVDDNILEHTIHVLRSINTRNLPDLYLNHCTGDRALAVLRKPSERRPIPARLERR